MNEWMNEWMNGLANAKYLIDNCMRNRCEALNIGCIYFTLKFVSIIIFQWQGRNVHIIIFYCNIIIITKFVCRVFQKSSFSHAVCWYLQIWEGVAIAFVTFQLLLVFVAYNNLRRLSADDYFCPSSHSINSVNKYANIKLYNSEN